MKANTIWVLVSGLAVGFLIGRELPRGGRSGSSDSGSDSAPAVARPSAAAPREIPADLLALEKEMKATEKLAGLKTAQRYAVLKVMADKPCDCGCPHGSTGKCLAEDPQCPRAPQVLGQAIDLAKQDKSVDDILAAVKKPDAPAAKPDGKEPQKVDVPAWSPIKGPKHAKVTIVEWSDFQCPFCSRVGPTLKEIEEKYPKDVRVIFRHQPLSFHDKAALAAEASMAAHAQGKFWEMHDALFAHQQELDRAGLEKRAQELSLNLARFKADLDGHKFKDQVDKDSRAGTSYGAGGTPTFFVNGRPLVGAQPFAAFKTIIDEEIKRADDLLKAGTPIDKLYDKLLESLPKPSPAAAAPAPDHVDIQPGDAPSKGPKNAPVTLIAFSDFQCPFCSRVVPTLKQLEDEYKDKLRIAFKHQPLSFHDKAHLAAEATMAAHAQGKFWEMHDALFAHQQELDRAGLEKRAHELGLNMAKFKQALDSGLYKAYVDKDSAEGTRVGAGGTPTFFINGNKLVGAQGVEAFKKVIDAELAKKK